MDQKRLILAAFLSLLVLIGWGFLFPAPERVAQPAPETALSSPSTRPAQAQDAVVVDPAVEEELTFEPLEATLATNVDLDGPTTQALFSNRGAQLISFRLKDVIGRDGGPLEMVRERESAPYPFALVNQEGDPLPVNEALFVHEVLAGEGTKGPGIRFEYRGSLGVVTKEFRFSDNGMFEVGIETNLRDWGVLLGPGLRNPTDKELVSRNLQRSASFSAGDGVEQLDAPKQRGDVRIPGAGVGWFALEDTYFLTTLAPRTPLVEVLAQPVLLVSQGEGAPHSFLPRPPEESISSTQEDLPQELQLALFPQGGEFQAAGYWGAKKYPRLAKLEGGLDRTIRWGTYIGVLSRPMLFMLLWIHDNVVGNFGWSIILLTVVIKVALFPLTHKSYVSMQKMQKLNPKIEAIKQKHRGKQRDKKGRPNMESQRKMNEEMQALFRSEGVNPAGGCLPMLLQMPVFFSFFALLRNSGELWNAPWTLWIQDLSAPDPWYALPIIMGGAQFLQQRMMPAASMNPSQRIIMNTMPVWFTVISFGFASGLVLYWLTNNILTIAQQTGYQRLKKAGYFGGEDAAAVVKPVGKKKERGKKK